jgi:hypothetical protein
MAHASGNATWLDTTDGTNTPLTADALENIENAIDTNKDAWDSVSITHREGNTLWFGSNVAQSAFGITTTSANGNKFELWFHATGIDVNTTINGTSKSVTFR